MTVSHHRLASDNEDEEEPLSSRAIVVFVTVVVAALLLPAAFPCRQTLTDWENGCQNRLHARANPVYPASVLRLPIATDSPIPGVDLRELERSAPFGYRADVLMQRAESAPEASEIFEDLCQAGWSFDGANQYDRTDFTYGGEGDNRYCASHVIQRRFYMGYVPICGSSRHYTSYVIVQRGDVIFAAYETTSSWAKTGQNANQALSEVMRQLR